MIKLETLTEFQTETLGGGRSSRGGSPSWTSQLSTIEINNLVSQSNVGSAWASSATATGGGGGYPFISIPMGGASEANAFLTQSNINNVSNWPNFSF
jgi:hypothetical protein